MFILFIRSIDSTRVSAWNIPDSLYDNYNYIHIYVYIFIYIYSIYLYLFFLSTPHTPHTLCEYAKAPEGKPYHILCFKILIQNLVGNYNTITLACRICIKPGARETITLTNDHLQPTVLSGDVADETLQYT